MNQEWQYLTDDEIKEILGTYASDIGPYVREMFDKIEAKIRDKNEQNSTASQDEDNSRANLES